MAILSEQIQNGPAISLPLHQRPLTGVEIPPPGADTVNKVIAGTATWSELFSKHDFFHRYRNYIQVLALTRDPQLQLQWYVFTYCAIVEEHPLKCPHQGRHGRV